jgi:iduronate 2-sulfatase
VATPSARPNVLLLLVDDLKPAIGAYGDRTAITPHLDRLVARGMRFDAAYCNQAVCAMSRFTLLLGARSTTTGLYQFGRNFRDTYPDAVTLPQLFMRHGYRAESMGKVFHVGHGTYGDDASWSLPAHAVNARVDLTHLRPFKNDPPPYHKNTDGLFGFGAEGSFCWGVG